MKEVLAQMILVIVEIYEWAEMVALLLVVGAFCHWEKEVQDEEVW